MKRVSILLVSSIIFINSLASVTAEEVTDQTPVQNTIAPYGIKEIDREVKQRIKDRLDTAKNERETIRANVQNRIEETRQEIEQKREQFRERISEFKDERKQAILERMDEKIVTLNTKWVTHANNVLSRLTLILDKIVSRTDRLAEEYPDLDVSGVRSAIEFAEAAIVSAQDLVNEQSGKSYVMEFESEATVQEDVTPTVSALRTDINIMMTEVRAARSAVQGALKELRVLIRLSNAE